MMRLMLLLCLIVGPLYGQKIQFIDAQTSEPVSFATVAFGNGLGSFADAQGEFLFMEKRHSEIDSLFISAIGYKELRIATENLESTYKMVQDIDELQEVVLTVAKSGKFKKREVKPISHTDYFNTWMLTVESELAVLFEREEEKPTQIASLLFPVITQETVNGKTIKSRPFSTMLRVQFYENKNGQPGREVRYGNIVFIVSEKDQKEIFELDVSDYNIFIPEGGLFVSLQALGTADADGKLLQTRKFNEIKTKRGVRRISISYRPLLPFTNEIKEERTFVRRVFLNNRKWQPVNTAYDANSELLKKGYINYKMGARLRVYEE